MTRGQRIGALALAAIVAVVAVIVLRPGEDDSGGADRRAATGKTTSAGAKKEAQRPEASPAYTTIRLRGGDPVGDPEEISLEQGETVRIEVRSDKAAELHIHGYDKYVNVEPGEPARTRFKANLEGIFEIENHDTAAQVAELRVNP